jgi:hypothetical protein
MHTPVTGTLTLARSRGEMSRPGPANLGGGWAGALICQWGNARTRAGLAGRRRRQIRR